MLNLERLLTKASAIADENNHLVIVGLLHRLEEILEKPAETLGCSYFKFMNAYLTYKFLYGRLTRNGGTSEAFSAIDRANTLMNQYHKALYQNPCRSCATCRSRKKKWPLNIRDVYQDRSYFLIH